MRNVYLIRHGRPDFPLEKRLCLGRTDLPLGALGRMQACRTALWMRSHPVETVCSSPLCRAVETARFFSDDVHILPDLREMDAGDWDGLDFREIKRRWPEIYHARGADPSLPIPNAEPAAAVRERAEAALRQAMAETTGDLLIAAHSFVIRSLLGDLSLRLPYASVTILGDPNAVGLVPDMPLTPELADALLSAAAPGENVEAHCRAVAREAVRIAEALPVVHDCVLLESAALLHDVARAEKRHAETAAAYLTELGYDRAARIVAQHHDHDGETLDEAAILFLADKCVAADRVVPIDQRFAESAEKCKTKEAREAHARRFAAAQALKTKINTLCRTEVVK